MVWWRVGSSPWPLTKQDEVRPVVGNQSGLTEPANTPGCWIHFTIGGVAKTQPYEPPVQLLTAIKNETRR